MTETRLTLSKEFKEIFMAVYKAGESPRKILENQKYGEFHQDYRPRGTADTHSVSADTSPDVYKRQIQMAPRLNSSNIL